MGAGQLTWIVTCLVLAGLWTVVASWRSEIGTPLAMARGVLGGLGALGMAYVGFGVCDILGVSLDWRGIARDSWSAVGLAVLIGVVEEGAKLTGILLAAPSLAWRNVVQTTAAVAAVFAVAEAQHLLPGESWPVALSRAAFGPVAHGLLALPMALALSGGDACSRRRLAGRVLLAFLVASALHAAGDWSVARPGWGRLGFAVTLCVPALWLHLRRRSRGEAARSVLAFLLRPPARAR